MLLLGGCNSGFFSNTVAEGVIEYALSFPEYAPDGLMAGMLPERTTVSFTEDKQVAELSAGMGIFRTTMVTDNSGKAMDYHLSLMSKRIVAHMLPKDLAQFNAPNGKPTILFTNTMDTIAGYPCRKAVAVFNDLAHREIEVWYTDRILMQDPNWFGPFAEVPGVLLRYDVVQYGIRMRLEAVKVTPGDVDPKLFDKKSDFQPVPAEVLQNEIAEVMNTFSM
jgi:GLPGLI family protein